MIITIWIAGIILCIISCFISKQYNKWVRANIIEWREYVITTAFIPIIGILTCIPFAGVAFNAPFILILLGNWIYLKYKNKWNEPF